jgi:proteasome accessory factor C
MAESALNRAARALDLVPYITENPGVAIEDLADKFQVSSQQIVKDLELIFLCGLPGYTPYELIDLNFEDGVVTIIEPQLS